MGTYAEGTLKVEIPKVAHVGHAQKPRKIGKSDFLLLY
jgi:hypothetical protein